MRSIAITVVFSLLSSSAAQTCSPAGVVLPCISQVCPTGQTCTGVGTADETCCTDAFVIAATVATTTAATTTVCADLVNPSTGVSDCPQRVAYCTNPTYTSLMAVQCRKTCGLCSSTTTTDTCVDLVNPATGTSDCPSLTSLCTNSVYLSLMQVQCRKTCGFCTSTTNTTVTTSTSTTTCVDLVNPVSGVSDCPNVKSLCTNSNYVTLMTTQCPLTCGFCTSSSNTTTATTATTTASTTTCVDGVNAATGTSDCPNRRALCTNAAYATLMRTQCPLTCGFCTAG